MQIPETSKWYVIHTRSRHEFKVFKQFASMEVEAFLPTVEKIRCWKDRKAKVRFPLFPGYLFVHIIPAYETMLGILKTVGVVRFLGLKPLEPEEVASSELNSLKLALEAGCELDPYPFLKKGQRVRVKRGALTGVEGFLVEKSGRHTLVLNVGVLREGASLKIEAADVEAIN